MVLELYEHSVEFLPSVNSRVVVLKTKYHQRLEIAILSEVSL